MAGLREKYRNGLKVNGLVGGDTAWLGVFNGMHKVFVVRPSDEE